MSKLKVVPHTKNANGKAASSAIPSSASVKLGDPDGEPQRSSFLSMFSLPRLNGYQQLVASIAVVMLAIQVFDSFNSASLVRTQLNRLRSVEKDLTETLLRVVESTESSGSPSSALAKRYLDSLDSPASTESSTVADAIRRLEQVSVVLWPPSEPIGGETEASVFSTDPSIAYEALQRDAAKAHAAASAPQPDTPPVPESRIKTAFGTPRIFYTTPEELASYFGVVYTHDLIVDLAFKDMVASHNLTQDEYYKRSPTEMERLARNYRHIFDNENGILDRDRRFYIRYTGEEQYDISGGSGMDMSTWERIVRWFERAKGPASGSGRGYGLFAAVDIPPEHVIGNYAGKLTDTGTDYSWDYNSKFITGDNLHTPRKETKLYIDAQRYGNLVRFVNHDQNPNCNVVGVPDWKNNVWRVVYVSNRYIARGEEITVSYGEGYWMARSLFPTLFSCSQTETKTSRVHSDAMDRAGIFGYSDIIDW
ncbi:hypothetical protein BJ742DRAFT_879441 [Cladochytrium replicatum]|nr:hypothetical protein BJ742DRAFT_879441 [Cladochytrium replicatum]